VTILSGSTSTVTDAMLSANYCRNTGISRAVVVTDPYHTRRADLVFNRFFQKDKIEMVVVSSENYGRLQELGILWWQERATRQAVWLEAVKCLHFLATGLVLREEDRGR
jgi:uncharacterized SAM-binding protein YcdF (DUF218 family)